MLIDAPLPLMVKPGGAVTVSSIEVSSNKLPDIPVIVTVTGPSTVAELVAVMVSTSVPLMVPGAKLCVTPLGNPVAVKLTAPLNPPTSVTVTMVVVLPPWATVTEPGEAERLKLGGTTTVSMTVVAAARV